MRQFSISELEDILSKHAMWLRNESGGRDANLTGANLIEVDFTGVNLSGALLCNADLRRACLYGADLSGADLSGARLRNADLRQANLSEAYLIDADLNRADLNGANLKKANLKKVNLIGANLYEADLSEANLYLTNLSAANLKKAIGGDVCRMDFGGWSICIHPDRTSIGCQTHSNTKWLLWTHVSPEIVEMDPNASEWWAVHGDAVKAAIRCVVAKAQNKECSNGT